MKKTFILLIIVAIGSTSSFAQIGGISASKLATLCAETVNSKSIEFEPLFGFAYAKEYWDKNETLKPIFSTADSVESFSAIGFRFSYGLFKNIEVGVTVPVDMSILQWGIKYKLPINGSYTLGLLGGFNMPAGNQYFNRKRHSLHNTSALVGGTVMTYKFSEKFSIDTDWQLQKYLQKTDENHQFDIYLNMDIGYYLHEGLQLACGLNYSSIFFEENSKTISLLEVNPGITVERAENFLIVLNMPFDVAGKNIYKSVGFSLALTITIN